MTRPGPSPEIVISERLILKLLRQESAGIIFQCIERNRRYFRTWLPFVDNTRKIEDTEAYVNVVIKYTGPKRDIVYEIWYLDDFAGLIALKEIDQWNKRAELGYWLDPRFEGQGIMTSSCQAVVNYAFLNLGLNRIQLKAGIGNARSCRIPERLGFKFEGIERSGEKFPDHYQDLEVYSILKNDWPF